MLVEQEAWSTESVCCFSDICPVNHYEKTFWYFIGFWISPDLKSQCQKFLFFISNILFKFYVGVVLNVMRCRLQQTSVQHWRGSAVVVMYKCWV